MKFSKGKTCRLRKKDISNSPGTDWMERSMNLISASRITEITLPGSHDSATSELTFEVSNDHGSEQIKALRKSYGSWLTNPIVMAWSCNQPLSITEQLHVGVRYLDLRLGHDTNKPGLTEGIRCCHGLWGASCQQVLGEVARFVGEMRHELVVLDFNHFYNMSSREHRHVLESIQQTLGHVLVPRDRWLAPVGELDGAGHRVFVFYHWREAVAEGHMWALESDGIESCWPEAKDTASLKRRLDSIMAQQSQRQVLGLAGEKVVVLQGILTEGRDEVIKGIVSSITSKFFACAPCIRNPLFAPSSVRQLSELINPSVCEWVSEEYATHCLVNVVLLDWIMCWKDVEWIVALNGRSPSLEGRAVPDESVSLLTYKV